MKKLFLIFFIPLNCFSQDSKIDSAIDIVKFDSVINSKGSANDLFVKAKIWLSDAFKSSKAVIETEDKENGIIIGKGSVTFIYDLYEVKKEKITTSYSNLASRAFFTIKIFLKDMKVKILITNIRLIEDDPINGFYSYANIKSALGLKNSTNLKDQIVYLSLISEYNGVNKSIKELIQSFSLYLNKKAENDF